MANIIDQMLATGARIGEVLALRWADVALDSDRPNLTINGTIKTEPGKGTYLKTSPKSDSSVRTVVLPDFATAVLRRRQAAARENPNEGVFPNAMAPGSRSTTSSAAGVSSARTRASTGSRPTFRKTMATLISERVDAETASQQIGHSSPAITLEFYISKPAIAADVAHALDELAEADAEGQNNSMTTAADGSYDHCARNRRTANNRTFDASARWFAHVRGSGRDLRKRTASQPRAPHPSQPQTSGNARSRGFRR